MINGTAGGHTFVNGECACGRKLVDIQWVTMEDLDKPGIAHSGRAVEYEIRQIMALAQKMRENIAKACGW